MKNPASWEEGVLLIIIYKVKGMADFTCSAHLLTNCALEEDISITIWGGWGSFVNKVSHTNKLIVSWKYPDPSQSVMIQQVPHYESLRDESLYSDLFLKATTGLFPEDHRSCTKITQC